MYFLGMDDFLGRFTEGKQVYLSGGVGSAKTALAVALSYWLHRSNLVDATVADVPIAWAIPAALAPLFRVCLIIDELGSFFDARQFGEKGANQFRKDVLQFPRKVESYIIVSSRLVVDASFRSFTCQRSFTLGPLTRYAYGEDNGVLDSVGSFWIWGLDKLYRSPVLPPPHKRNRFFSTYYATKYIPRDLQPIRDWVVRAVEEGRGVKDKDPNESMPYLEYARSLEVVENVKTVTESIPAPIAAGSGIAPIRAASSENVSVTPDWQWGDLSTALQGERGLARKSARELLGGGSKKGARVLRSDSD